MTVLFFGSMKVSVQTELLDRLGVAASLACGVHCVMAPLAIGAMAVVPAGWLFSHTSETVMLALTLLIGAASLVPSYRATHRRKSCLTLFVLGGATLATAKLALHGADAEPWLLATGAVMIASAHLSNLRFCRTCKKCAGDH